MAFNTGNPLGSTDPRDLSDNSENLDRAVNNAASATWIDRFGKSRTSLAGQIGYIGTGVDGAIEDYASGQVLSTYNTIIRYSSEFYRPSASATLPYTTTATLPDVDANLVAIGDANLRQDLAGNPSAGSGAALVNGATIYVGSVAELEALSLPVGTAVYLTEEGRAGEFVVKTGTPPSDPQKGVYIILANGNYAERQFRLSEGIFISWFGAVSDSGTTDNSAAIQAAYDFASGEDGARYVVWDGRYGFGTTITIPDSTTTRGNPADAFGSTGTTASTQIWTGGAASMFSVTTSRCRWLDLGVWNKSGLATDWIYLGPGAILPYWDNINFNLPELTQRFTRSVIYSFGQRLGYGKLKRINTGGAIAPKFVFLNGEAEAFVNRVTTFGIYDSVFGAASGETMTVFYIKNQGIETLNIENNSFNNNSTDSNLVVVSSTDTPITDTIFNLNFNGNEIDHIGTDPNLSKFRLTNVRSISFENNEASCGGQMLHLVRLFNSHVTRYAGNTIRSLAGSVFSHDANSTVTAGNNRWGVSGTPQPLVNEAYPVTRRFTQSDTSVAILDFASYNASGHNIREVDVNTSSSFSLRALVNEITPGTVFTLVYRNITAGNIQEVNLFPDHFAKSSAALPPAAGNSRSFTFYHNGTKFAEINRSGVDVPNS